jgi:hypothetical protein
MKPATDMSIILSPAWKVGIRTHSLPKKWSEMDVLERMLGEWGGIEMT